MNPGKRFWTLWTVAWFTFAAAVACKTPQTKPDNTILPIGGPAVVDEVNAAYRDCLGRAPGQADQAIWYKSRVLEARLGICTSEEAKVKKLPTDEFIKKP